MARRLVGLFYRQVEVAFAAEEPLDGPVVFVANHVNGLIDAGLLLAYLPRAPRFLAKSTLWGHPLVRPLLELAAAIPVYRRQDPGVDPSKNVETFTRCREVLLTGGSIALFPEGRSHNEPGLVALKTGVSRIVLETAATRPGFAPAIVPVGLSFDDKGRLRSRALVMIGQPVEPTAEIELYRGEPERAVRRLTDRVRRALAGVALSYPTWREAKWIQLAAEVFERPSSDLPAERSLAEELPVRRAFLESYEDLKARYPERVSAVLETVHRYEELLAIHRLRDAQVASRYPPSRVARFLVKSLWLLALRLPLAALGTVLSWGPYRLIGWVARRWGKTEDQLATYKLLGALVFYPAAWSIEALAVGWLAGPWASVAVVLAAPLSSWVALRFHQRRRFVWREAGAFLRLRGGGGSIRELRRLRASIVDGVRELAAASSRAGRPHLS